MIFGYQIVVFCCFSWYFRGVDDNEDSGENCVRSEFVVLVVQLVVLSFAPLQAQVSCLNKRSSGKWIQRNHDWTVGILSPGRCVDVWHEDFHCFF